MLNRISSPITAPTLSNLNLLLACPYAQGKRPKTLASPMVAYTDSASPPVLARRNCDRKIAILLPLCIPCFHQRRIQGTIEMSVLAQNVCTRPKP
jgi:hypothetical protein